MFSIDEFANFLNKSIEHLKKKQQTNTRQNGKKINLWQSGTPTALSKKMVKFPTRSRERGQNATYLVVLGVNQKLRLRTHCFSSLINSDFKETTLGDWHSVPHADRGKQSAHTAHTARDMLTLLLCPPNAIHCFLCADSEASRRSEHPHPHTFHSAFQHRNACPDVGSEPILGAQPAVVSLKSAFVHFYEIKAKRISRRFNYPDLRY